MDILDIAIAVNKRALLKLSCLVEGDDDDGKKSRGNGSAIILLFWFGGGNHWDAFEKLLWY